MPKPAPIYERVVRKLEPELNTGCLLWNGAVTRDGYGVVNRGYGVPGSLMAHRVAYEHERGPIPAGLVIDHLCRTPACCNTAHMEIVTSGENVLRGVCRAAVNARKTECLNGHPLSGRNLITSRKGWRNCRICKNNKNREWMRSYAYK